MNEERGETMTPVINSVEDKASLNRAKAKKIVEELFKVKVK